MAADGARSGWSTPVNEVEIKKLLDARISRARAKEILIELVKVPSPQTELLEDEPLLKEFINKAVEPRLRAMGFSDLRHDAMGNLIAVHGAGANKKSLMFIGNAMNQPASTMPNPYGGDVVDGAKYGLPGECVMGKGASEQKANLAAMLHAMETVIASGVPLAGKLIFTCCLSGETGKHDAIKSVVEGAGVRADMAVLGGSGLKITLGNRGRIDVFVTVKGSPCHSSRPWDGINAITGATEAIRALLDKVKLERSHPQLGKQSLTVNHIRSFPDSTHTVQERCELTLDRRLLPGDDPSEAFAEIERIAKEVEQLEDPVSGKAYGVDVRLGPFMYPSLVNTDSPIVRAILRASEVMLGRPAETHYSASAFDQGYLNHVGIITANFGAGEHEYAHTDLDMASVERTTDCARVYAFMMLDYLT
jgi:acetylornithine deacetylase/succinyl-diaminopimelate desuccinylase-like protein